jgi:hypothetical protein
MTIAQIFFKKKNLISTIELDIIITEGAVATARVTSNPVENGADSNDHIIIDPMSFTTTGVVSDASSGTIDQFSRVADTFTKSTSRSADAWEDLLRMQAGKIPFTLVQGLRRYSNVILLSLSEQQDKDTANGLFFTATMKELILAGSGIVETDQFNEPSIAEKMVETVKGGLKQLVEVF